MKAKIQIHLKISEGYIGKIGFSFHDTPDVFEHILMSYPWDFAQIQFNYLDWDLLDAKQNYSLAKKKRIPLTIMEPVRGGALAQLLPETSASLFQKARPGVSPATWALRWVASHNNIAVTLSGMSNYNQVVENIKTFENFEPLEQWEYSVIKDVVEEIKKNNLIGCTGCRYCDICPKHIAIPQVFSLYNQHNMFKNASTDFRTRFSYSQLPKESLPDNCIKCRLCVKHCPQHIPIPDLFPAVQELFSDDKTN